MRTYKRKYKSKKGGNKTTRVKEIFNKLRSNINNSMKNLQNSLKVHNDVESVSLSNQVVATPVEI